MSLVQMLDQFEDCRDVGSDPLQRRSWVLGQDKDAAEWAVARDPATLLLSHLARWCEGCVGVVKVVAPGDRDRVPATGAGGGWRREGTRSDPDAPGRADLALPFEDQQRDLELMLSVWQVWEGGGAPVPVVCHYQRGEGRRAGGAWACSGCGVALPAGVPC
jgi:hypothetical protein